MDATIEQARAHFLSGNAHFEAGRFDDAHQAYAAALVLVPGRASVQANLGITLCRLRRWREASEALEAALLGDPTHADAWAALGLCREATDQWAGAAHALRQAFSLGAGSAALRLSLALCEARQGRADAALDALDEALAMDPSLTEAWSQRGHLLREAGHLAEAARCYEQALAHGAEPGTHRFYLAAVTDAADPPPPPATYAARLFDEYAQDFQDHLVADLGYQAPQTLLQPLIESGRRFGAVLDLGCGSGLCAALLAPHAQAIDGVDVSAAMVERARAGGFYRRVEQGDLLHALQTGGETLDLVVAADVFIYVGALAPVFAAVAARLRAGGVFAFTVEQADAGRELQLRPSLRYAHSRASIERLAAAHGLPVQALWAAPIRQEQRRPVPGWYALLRRD